VLWGLKTFTRYVWLVGPRRPVSERWGRWLEIFLLNYLLSYWDRQVLKDCRPQRQQSAQTTCIWSTAWPLLLSSSSSSSSSIYFARWQYEKHLPLPSQPKLVLIYRNSGFSTTAEPFVDPSVLFWFRSVELAAAVHLQLSACVYVRLNAFCIVLHHYFLRPAAIDSHLGAFLRERQCLQKVK